MGDDDDDGAHVTSRGTRKEKQENKIKNYRRGQFSMMHQPPMVEHCARLFYSKHQAHARARTCRQPSSLPARSESQYMIVLVRMSMQARHQCMSCT